MKSRRSARVLKCELLPTNRRHLKNFTFPGFSKKGSIVDSFYFGQQYGAGVRLIIYLNV
jgi:hypothetical protein